MPDLSPLDHLHEFLASATRNWPTEETLSDPEQIPHLFFRRYELPNSLSSITCVYWHGMYLITGTDICRVLAYEMNFAEIRICSQRKFEEGVFSDLRAMKTNQDAILEQSRSELLAALYKEGCIKTQKRQKVFHWGRVRWKKLLKISCRREAARLKLLEANPYPSWVAQHSFLSTVLPNPLEQDAIKGSNPEDRPTCLSSSDSPQVEESRDSSTYFSDSPQPSNQAVRMLPTLLPRLFNHNVLGGISENGSQKNLDSTLDVLESLQTVWPTADLASEQSRLINFPEDMLMLDANVFRTTDLSDSRDPEYSDDSAASLCAFSSDINLASPLLNHKDHCDLTSASYEAQRASFDFCFDSLFFGDPEIGATIPSPLREHCTSQSLFLKNLAEDKSSSYLHVDKVLFDEGMPIQKPIPMRNTDVWMGAAALSEQERRDGARCASPTYLDVPACRGRIRGLTDSCQRDMARLQVGFSRGRGLSNSAALG